MKTGQRQTTSLQDSDEHSKEPVRKSSREKKRNVCDLYEYEISKKCRTPNTQQQKASLSSSPEISKNTKTNSVKGKKGGKDVGNGTEDDVRDAEVQKLTEQQQRNGVRLKNSEGITGRNSKSQSSETRNVITKSSKTRNKDHTPKAIGNKLKEVSSQKKTDTEKKLGTRKPREALSHAESVATIDCHSQDSKTVEIIQENCRQNKKRKSNTEAVLPGGEDKATKSPKKQISESGLGHHVRRSERSRKRRLNDDEDDYEEVSEDIVSKGQEVKEELDSCGDEYEPEEKRKRKENKKLSFSEKKHPGMRKGSKSRECYCTYCGKMFKSRKHVTVHERIHSGEKPFSCSVCGQRFVLKANMKHHEQLHCEDRPFMCEICGKCFKTNSYCRAHRKIHETMKQFKCDIPGCEKAFSNRRNCHLHLLYHRGEKPFTCTVCGKSFRRKSDLNIHSSVHSESKRFLCSVCGKKFSQNYAHNAHLMLHKRKPHNCGKCRRFFATETEKNAHEQLHSKYPFYDCEICERDNIELRFLAKHLKKVHNVDSMRLRCPKCLHSFPTQNIYDQHTGALKQLQFTCNFCSEVLKSACELYEHKQKHRHDKDDTLVNGDGKIHICNVCSKEFSRKSSLYNHKQLHKAGNYKCSTCGKESKTKNGFRAHVRTHSGVKPFCCETCGKSFASRTTLQEHFLIHTGEKPHICSICQKAFRTRALLKEHGNVHSSGNPHKCELCGKEYASRTNYRNHVNVHKGQRNYECQICGKRFFAKYVLRKHVQIHTGQKNYQCEFCGKGFIQHGNWLIHRRSHTGEKPHSCPHCPAGFVNSTQLKSHIKRVHDQKKEFMCDKCYKHFHDRKGLQAHMHNIHVKKEHGRIYPCSKCDKLFALQENQCSHEMDCTESKPYQSLRPSVLQQVLKKVYAQPQTKVVQGDNSLQSHPQNKDQNQTIQTVLQTKHVKNENINILSDRCVNLIQEPVQVIEDSQSNPVPCPAQQFQIISQEESLSTSDDCQASPLKTSPPSSPAGNTETSEAQTLETEIPFSHTVVKMEGDPEQNICSDVLGTHTSTTYNAEQKQHVKSTYPSSSDLIIQCTLCNNLSITIQEAMQHKKLHQKQEPSCSSAFTSDITNISGERTRETDLGALVTTKIYNITNISGEGTRDTDHDALVTTKISNTSHDPQFQCMLCEMVFTCKREARQHRKLHQKELLYQCSLCRSRFATSTSLTTHLQTHFQPTKQRNTQVDNQMAMKDSDIAAQTNDVCLKSFSLFGLLNTHKDSHRLNTLLKCNVCGGKFMDRRKFEIHYKTHTSQKGFKCDDCDRSFHMERVFKVHKRFHKLQKPHECSQCSIEFRYASQLRRHLRIHTALNPSVTASSNILSSLEQISMSQSTSQEAVVSLLSDFTCDVCNSKFSTTDKLAAHYSLHAVSGVDYLCQICNLYFKEESTFTDHIKLHGEVMFEEKPDEELKVEEVFFVY